MRAAIAERAGQPLVLREVSVPEIGPDEILLKVAACGVCYTDLRVIDSRVAGPLIPGHEPVGSVAAVGVAVSGLRPGDRVGVHSLFSCGDCDYCRAGEEEACVEGFTRLAGVGVDGGYAEYMRLPADHAVRLPDGLAFDDAAPFLCAGLTTYAGLKNGGLQPGQRAVILGIGGLGHLAIPLAKAMGATVYAVTSSPDKADAARARGADVVGDVATMAAELTAVGGAHVALNTANGLDPVGGIVPAMAKQGAIVLTAADGDVLPVPPALLMNRQLRVIGSFFGSRRDLREVLELAQNHAIRPMIETYPLSDVNTVHTRLRNNLVRFRAVLVP
jgi:propanol-preferring alcohol dehydrogenase